MEVIFIKVQLVLIFIWPDMELARPVGCKGPLIGCLVGVCSLAGGMQSERAGLAPEIRKFRPFLQSLAAVMRVECVGGLP